MEDVGWVDRRHKKGCWIKEAASEMKLMDNLTSFMAYWTTYAVRGNEEGTKMEKLQAVISMTLKHWMSLTLPLGHFRVKALRQRGK